VDHHVVQFSGVLSVLLSAESGEALIVQIGPEGTVAGHEAVESQIELLTADEQGTVDVLRDHIGLPEVDLVLGKGRVVGPLLDLCELVHEENTFALCTGIGFHDPCFLRLSSELLHEYGVIARKHVSLRDNVHVYEVTLLVFLCQWVAFLFHLTPETLNVFNHRILAGQLEVVWEVIQKS